jgi:cell filamentation protein
MFAHHAHIGGAAASIFHQLGEEKHLAGLDPASFSDRAAHDFAALNALHPFREGNGRTQREFVSHLAYAAGYYLAWEKMKPPDLLQASIESFQGDTSKLAALIRENLTPSNPDPSSSARRRK